MSGNQSGVNNTAIGTDALAGIVNGGENVAIGLEPLFNAASAHFNVAIGRQALFSTIYGLNNIAIGNYAMENTVGNNALDGVENTAVGVNALNANTTGSRNIALGKDAGNAPTNPSDGIFIGNAGVSGDNATIKIGTQGTQTSAYIAGIYSQSVDSMSGAAVSVDINGKLGTTLSSRRYKYDIETMPDMSTMLGKLRPVTFHYKKPQHDGSHPLEYGLIAEEVADVFPSLAVLNKDGTPETVKYQLLPSFLLAGWQAQQKTIAAQSEKIEALEARLRRLETLLPQTKAAALR